MSNNRVTKFRRGCALMTHFIGNLFREYLLNLLTDPKYGFMGSQDLSSAGCCAQIGPVVFNRKSSDFLAICNIYTHIRIHPYRYLLSSQPVYCPERIIRSTNLTTVYSNVLLPPLKKKTPSIYMQRNDPVNIIDNRC